MAIHFTSDGVVWDATNAPAQDSGSGVSNTLDDYEEGTWDSGIGYQNGTDNAAVSNIARTSTYTKIGNIVSVGIMLRWTGGGTVADNINMTGFPFTPLHGGSYGYANFLCRITGPSNTIQYNTQLSATTSPIILTCNGLGNLGSQVGSGEHYLGASGTYRTAV